MAWLYLVEHKDTGKCYVGWCKKDPHERWKRHCSDAKHPKYYFQHSIKKYGREAFDLYVISYFDSIDEAKQAEIYWIAYLKESCIELFNSTNGGDGALGFAMNDEQRQRFLSAIRRPGKPSQIRNPNSRGNKLKARLRQAAIACIQICLHSDFYERSSELNASPETLVRIKLF